jgi:hypothetical protein
VIQHLKNLAQPGARLCTLEAHISYNDVGSGALQLVCPTFGGGLLCCGAVLPHAMALPSKIWSQWGAEQRSAGSRCGVGAGLPSVRRHDNAGPVQGRRCHQVEEHLLRAGLIAEGAAVYATGVRAEHCAGHGLSPRVADSL